jgi:hypothetical protein
LKLSEELEAATVVGSAEVVVADSFALYRISTGHTPEGAALRKAVLNGSVKILAPALSFTVSCGMETCWDDECRRDHPETPGRRVQDFHRQTGFEIVQPTVADSVSAGRSYRRLSNRRVVGPEVLAACFARLLADDRRVPLLSTSRALYCYVDPHTIGDNLRFVR